MIVKNVWAHAWFIICDKTVTKLYDCIKLVVLMTAKLGISVVKTIEYGRVYMCELVWGHMNGSRSIWPTDLFLNSKFSTFRSFSLSHSLAGRFWPWTPKLNLCLYDLYGRYHEAWSQPDEISSNFQAGTQQQFHGLSIHMQGFLYCLWVFIVNL